MGFRSSDYADHSKTSIPSLVKHSNVTNSILPANNCDWYRKLDRMFILPAGSRMPEDS